MIPVSAGDAGAGRDRRVPEHVRRPDPGRDPVNLVEFGNALAGRGPELNSALGRLPGVLDYLEPVMANLGSPRTRLDRFVRAISATAAEVVPVAAVQAQLFVDLDTTFTAFAEVARPYIQETISESPPTLDAGTAAFPVIRPFLANSASLFTELRPGVNALAAAAPDVADALETGTPVLRESDQLNDQLAPTAASLAAFGEDAGVRSGLARLQQTVDIFGPLITFVTPAQTVCNYGGLLFRNTASLLQQKGTWAAQRFTVFDPPDGINNEGSPSSGPANGGGSGANVAGNFLHYNPYPNTASPGQTKECEAGNEPYKVGQQVIGNVRRATRARSPTTSRGSPTTPPTRPRPRPRPRRRRTRADVAVRQKRRPSEIHRDPSKPIPDERVWGRTYVGPAPWVFGLLLVVADRLRRLHGVREEAAVERRRVHAQRDVRERGVAADDQSGADRRRQRRQGDDIDLDGDTAEVTFNVEEDGQPIHSDATIEIRPRLFLEGNFFLDLSPGSPSAPILDSGDDIPITQTATAVQIDEVLSALQQPTRRGLKQLLEGYGEALTYEPTAADDADQDPSVAGRDGGRVAERLAADRRARRDATRRSSTRRCSARTRTTSRR